MALRSAAVMDMSAANNSGDLLVELLGAYQSSICQNARMARETLIRFIDDIDGTVIDDDGATVGFALEGRVYEIDLSRDNLNKLRAALDPFVSAARSVTGAQRVTRSGRATSASRPDTAKAAIRIWARTNGFDVGDRGRVSDEIVEAYRKAH